MGGQHLDASEEGVARALRSSHRRRVAVERSAEGSVEPRLTAGRTERREPRESLDEDAEEARLAIGELGDAAARCLEAADERCEQGDARQDDEGEVRHGDHVYGADREQVAHAVAVYGETLLEEERLHLVRVRVRVRVGGAGRGQGRGWLGSAVKSGSGVGVGLEGARLHRLEIGRKELLDRGARRALEVLMVGGHQRAQ